MKNILLLGLAILVLIALFGDGGLEVSPSVSPSLDFKPALEFSPNVSYAPDRSVNTTNIETNIEHQTVIVQQPSEGILQRVQTLGRDESGGLTIIDPPGTTCTPLPGETIVNGPDIKGACTVQDAAGNRFFLNAVGSRWPLASTPGGNAGQLQPASEPNLEQMQAAYLRNGGSLPFNWSWFGEDRKRRYLADRAETWQ